MSQEKMNLKTTSKGRKSFLKRNWLNILLGAFLAAIIFVPGTKSWMLEKAMLTGLFNASIAKAPAGNSDAVADFKFRDENNDVVDVSSLRGKVVFINFWASWCPPCIAEMPSVGALYDQFKDNPNVYFLLINEDENNAVADTFLRKNNYSIPIHRIAGVVPVDVYSGTLPTTLVLDKQGRIRLHHKGLGKYNSGKFLQQFKSLIDE